MPRVIADTLSASAPTQLDWLRSLVVCGCALALIFADRGLLSLVL